jgi:hypothetical protein
VSQVFVFAWGAPVQVVVQNCFRAKRFRDTIILAKDFPPVGGSLFKHQTLNVEGHSDMGRLTTLFLSCQDLGPFPLVPRVT